MLTIENLHVSVEEAPILKGLSLTINPGEIHAIMGPNGAGKSTLAKVFAGHPDYHVTKGNIIFKGQDLLALQPEERAQLGAFVAFQSPPEIPGVTFSQFLHKAYNSLRKESLSKQEFEELLYKKMQLLQIPPSFKERHLNAGFSGGEKKRSEMLQMALFDPAFALLDEIDSGLDIDALRHVAFSIKNLMRPEKAMLLITHYKRLLDLVTPHYVHVLKEGKIIQSGTEKLALELEERGYTSG